MSNQLVDRLRAGYLSLKNCAGLSPAFGGYNTLAEAADALEAMQAGIERRNEALKDLAEAARNACDANRYPPLTEALAEADYLVARSLKEVGDG